jgi:lipopolysaccharide export LptBFGC system permease protein LptF
MALIAMTIAIAGSRRTSAQGLRIFFYTGCVSFTLYFFKDVIYAFGKSESIPYILAAWMPTLLTGLMATFMILYGEEK